MATHRKALVTIIGGGITGLTCAFRLMGRAPELSIRLLEASPRLGGLIETIETEGMILERGADTLVPHKPAARELAIELGLEHRLRPVGAGRSAPSVVSGGRISPVPSTLLGPPRDMSSWFELLSSRLLGWRGKLEILGEARRPKRVGDGDETVGQFITRRYGPVVLERLAEPIFGGIFLADRELSMRANIPSLVALEARFGSVGAGLKQRAAQSPPSPLCFEAGMTELVDALVGRLDSVEISTETPLVALSSQSDGYWIDTPDERFRSDAVVLACPPRRVAPALSALDRPLADLLASSPELGCAVITLAWPGEMPRRLESTSGFFVTKSEDSPLLAATYVDRKFSWRLREKVAVLRVFIGGKGHPKILENSDEELAAMATSAIAAWLGEHRPPIFVDLVRRPESMPLRGLGHAARIAELDAAASAHPGLILAGRCLGIIGVPDSISSAGEAAQRVLEFCAALEPAAHAAADSNIKATP